MYGEGKTYPRVCVSGLLKNPHGKVLLTRRSNSVWYPGLWCLPGGHVDGGQDWISALRSEVREEVGIDVLQETLLGIYSDPSLNILADSVTGEKRCFIAAAFLITAFSGQVKLSDEISEFGWYDESDRPEGLIEAEAAKFHDAFQFNGTPFVR